MEVNGLVHDQVSLHMGSKSLPRCKLTRRLGGPHSQAGHFGEEKNLLLLDDKTIS